MVRKSRRDDRTRSEAISELFDITKSELPLKCETPPGLLEAFAMMETVEYALTIPDIKVTDTREEIIKKLSSKRDLSEYYREKRDRRSVSKSRRGRKELETVIASQGREDVDELTM